MTMIKGFYRFFLLSLFLLNGAFSFYLYAQSGSGNYCYTERTDLRRYDNGKYIGLKSREVRSFITRKKSNTDETFYDGNFYVWQETRRNKVNVRGKINEAIPSSFFIDKKGSMSMVEDRGFPSFRSFPSFAESESSWTAESVRAVDPKENGIITRIPFLAQYTYVKDEKYMGQDAAVLKAKWATRYGENNLDENGDPDLVRAEGSHNATICISKKTGAALLVRDQVDETYYYRDGSKIAFKGSIVLFTEYPPAVDHKAVGKAVKKAGIPVEQTDAGLRLRIADLNFVADSAELLPGQEELLEKIAGVLKEAKDSSFLVEGHTADTNEPVSEMKLSKERAFAVAKKLSLYGIPEEKFICKGYGAARPLADNSTKEGMAANRRVEITILE